MTTEEFSAELFRIKDAINPLAELEKFQEFLRCEETDWSRAALAYIQGFVLPALSGAAKTDKQVPFSVSIRLFRVDQKVSWEKWMEMFPDSAIEVREDRDGGQTLLYGLPYKPEWALERKAGVFYSPNGFNAEPSAGHKSRRSIDNVKRFNATWADFDVGESGKEAALSSITKLPVTPSVVVETRNGFHVLYRLKGGCDLAAWQVVQNAIIEETKSDKACKDASRLLRMPGSWHCKDMWKGGDPYFVRAIWLSKQEYEIGNLLDSFLKPVNKANFQAPPNTFFANRPRLENVRSPQPASLPAGQRHGSLLEEAGRLYANLDEARAGDARAMLKEWYKRSSQPLKQNWEREVDLVASWMEEREFGHVVSN